MYIHALNKKIMKNKTKQKNIIAEIRAVPSQGKGTS